MVHAAAADVARRKRPASIARRLHSTLVEVIALACERIRRDTRIADVVLTGGVFLNAVLTVEAEARLVAGGLRVHRHQLVPPNDGGLALGQLLVCGGYREVEERSTAAGPAPASFRRHVAPSSSREVHSVGSVNGTPARSRSPTDAAALAAGRRLAGIFARSAAGGGEEKRKAVIRGKRCLGRSPGVLRVFARV